MKRMNGKRFYAVMLISLVLSLALSVNAFAATRRVRTMKTSKSYNVNYQNASGAKSYRDSVNWRSTNVIAYHKVRIPGNGRLMVYNNVDSRGYGYRVALCNSSSKVLEPSGNGTFTSTTRISAYGVRKGTYYIRVKGVSSYSLFAWYVPMSNGGTSKSRAKTVRVTARFTTGVLAAGESRSAADWYKVKVTKTRRYTLTVRAIGHGRITVSLLGNNGNTVILNPQLNLSSPMRLWHSNGTGHYSPNIVNATLTLTPGTYYVKVSRAPGAAYNQTSAALWVRLTNAG